MKTSIQFLLLLFCVCLMSCASYIDKKAGKVSVMDGYLQFEKNDDRFVYKLNQKFTWENETITPISYSVKLPTKLKYFDVGRMKSLFDYGNDQFILIVQNETPGSSESSKLTEEDWDKLVIAKFDIEGLHKLKLDEFHLRNDRSSAIINKGSISIILYNIKNKEFKTFVDYISTMQIL